MRPMAKKARNFSRGFKLDAVRRMAEATSIVGLSERVCGHSRRDWDFQLQTR